MFAQLYLCPKCGEVWKDVRIECVDIERGEFAPMHSCGNSVREVTHEGKPVVHALTEAEAMDDVFMPDDIEGEGALYYGL